MSAADVDAYIAAFPETTRARLEAVRASIRAAAPEATERIAYGIPTFQLKRNLVHFAGYDRHVGLYPGPTGIAAFADELAGYTQGKGSVRFPHDAALPLELIARIVAFRVGEERARG